MTMCSLSHPLSLSPSPSLLSAASSGMVGMWL